MPSSIASPVLEVGGSKQLSKPSTLPEGSAVIDVSKLPNPYTVIDKKLLAREPQAILDWILDADARSAPVMERVVTQAACELSAGRSVRLQCYGGRDRSQAVAWRVLSTLDASVRDEIEVRVLDAEPMACFAGRV